MSESYVGLACLAPRFTSTRVTHSGNAGRCPVANDRSSTFIIEQFGGSRSPGSVAIT
jgi:hypothetical protein